MQRNPHLVLGLALLLSACAEGEAAKTIVVTRLAPGDVPAGAAHRGSVEAARTWRDATGDNLLLLTRTEEMDTIVDESRMRQREIYGYHYVRDGDRYRLLWRTNDFVRECDLDIALSYAPGSLQVTDVDGDGTAETSYVYDQACMGGLDPATVKLILHEGATKYAIRGSADLRDIGPTYPAPEMRPDAALVSQPLLYAHAEREWNRFIRTNRWPDEGAP